MTFLCTMLWNLWCRVYYLYHTKTGMLAVNKIDRAMIMNHIVVSPVCHITDDNMHLIGITCIFTMCLAVIFLNKIVKYCFMHKYCLFCLFKWYKIYKVKFMLSSWQKQVCILAFFLTWHSALTLCLWRQYNPLPVVAWLVDPNLTSSNIISVGKNLFSNW